MKSVILLVTWFIAGQQPSSYQSIFSSVEACESARTAVFAEANRLKAQRDQDVTEKAKAWNSSPSFLLTVMPPAPTVTAVCAVQ